MFAESVMPFTIPDCGCLYNFLFLNWSYKRLVNITSLSKESIYDIKFYIYFNYIKLSSLLFMNSSKVLLIYIIIIIRFFIPIILF